jgi:hypothetical protein
MTKFTSLTVFGCSFSDYLDGGIEQVYGDHLAGRMGLVYQHQGRGGGSNYAIWRRCHEMYSAGELQDSLVIIQYTEPMRQEFFVNRRPYGSWQQPSDQNIPPSHNEEAWGTGTVIRWKMGADQWQNTRLDRDFFRRYQGSYVNAQWADSQFLWHHQQFCAWIRQVGLTVLFLKCRIFPDFPLDEPWASTAFRDPTAVLLADQYRYEPTDRCHLNDLGHGRLAELMWPHIQQHFLDSA